MPSDHKKFGSESSSLTDSVLEQQGFKIVSKIGSGTYGVVVKASVTSGPGGGLVAIKVIHKRTALKKYLSKFLPRELAILSRLRHPNVVITRRAIETPNRVYIVMDLASHGDLLEFLQSHEDLGERRSCRWFHHLVDGVAYLHGKGVGHRDLKCENLLICQSHVLKISDFSFARSGIPMDVEGQKVNEMDIFCSTYCGSFAYSAPEVLKGRPYEVHLSDTWSMGVVLYTMACNRLPFDDTDFSQLLKEVERPVRFSPSRPVSEQLRKLLDRIFQPSRRRIYIPEIRRTSWYKDYYQQDWMPVPLKRQQRDRKENTGQVDRKDPEFAKNLSELLEAGVPREGGNACGEIEDHKRHRIFQDRPERETKSGNNTNHRGAPQLAQILLDQATTEPRHRLKKGRECFTASTKSEERHRKLQVKEKTKAVPRVVEQALAQREGLKATIRGPPKPIKSQVGKAVSLRSKLRKLFGRSPKEKAGTLKDKREKVEAAVPDKDKLKKRVSRYEDRVCSACRADGWGWRDESLSEESCSCCDESDEHDV